ncbi:ubiquitin carboxyl-terminal hydrolase 17-like protein 6 [Canis lupus baileyi]|uniref:ubiquitin carboxyl-terminal hydrolase 17-like protein 6 n=1 Tax=Canis lupus baileyi TaxID=143281 RepID=UPI003B97774A
MEAAHLHPSEEPQFSASPKPQSCWSRRGGAEVHGGPSVPETTSPASKTLSSPTDPLAPASAGLPPTKTPLSWKSLSQVGAGLQNMGNTCYVNATLQCLTYTEPLASYMLSQQHGTTYRRQTSCMLCTLQAHLTRVLCHPGRVLRPLPLLLAAFHRHKQEDAHEYLMFILDAMQQACLPEDKLSDPERPQDSTLIQQLFGGYWRSQIQCLHCQGISSTLEPYLDISLDIGDAHSVSQALEQLVKPELLEGENAYHCRKCLEKVPASKVLTLHTSPKVLILVLRRFSDLTGNKMTKEVQYPERLDMQHYLSEQRAGPLVYVLYAVLVHAGRSCHSGHYFCFVKAGNGQWYKMDDAKVSACDVTCELRQPAYVLFYMQKTDLERDLGRESVKEGGLASPEADPTVVGEASGEPATDPSVNLPALEERGEETSRQQMTLDQWRCLQECNRPKPELNVRRREIALPANAVILHHSKYRPEMPKNHPQQTVDLLTTAAGMLPPQVAGDVAKVPRGAGALAGNGHLIALMKSSRTELLEHKVRQLLLALQRRDVISICSFLDDYRGFATTDEVLDLLSTEAISCMLEIWLDYFRDEFCQLPEFPSLRMILEFMRQRMPGSDVELHARRYLQQFRRLQQRSQRGFRVMELVLAAGAEDLVKAEMLAPEFKVVQMLVEPMIPCPDEEEPPAPAATPEE